MTMHCLDLNRICKLLTDDEFRSGDLWIFSAVVVLNNGTTIPVIEARRLLEANAETIFPECSSYLCISTKAGVRATERIYCKRYHSVTTPLHIAKLARGNLVYSWTAGEIECFRQRGITRKGTYMQAATPTPKHPSWGAWA